MGCKGSKVDSSNHKKGEKAKLVDSASSHAQNVEKVEEKQEKNVFVEKKHQTDILVEPKEQKEAETDKDKFLSKNISSSEEPVKEELEVQEATEKDNEKKIDTEMPKKEKKEVEVVAKEETEAKVVKKKSKAERRGGKKRKWKIVGKTEDIGDSKVKIISCCKKTSEIWVLNEKDELYHYHKDGDEFKWKKIDSEICDVCVGLIDGACFGLNKKMELVRFTPGAEKPWEVVEVKMGDLDSTAEKPDEKTTLVLDEIDVGSSKIVYGIKGKLVYGLIDGEIKKFSGKKLDVITTNTSGDVYGLKKKFGKIYRYNKGISKWEKFAGKLSDVHVDEKGNLWGVLSDQVFFYSRKKRQWKNVSQKEEFKGVGKLCVGNIHRIWVVKGGQIYEGKREGFGMKEYKSRFVPSPKDYKKMPLWEAKKEDEKVDEKKEEEKVEKKEKGEEKKEEKVEEKKEEGKK